MRTLLKALAFLVTALCVAALILMAAVVGPPLFSGALLLLVTPAPLPAVRRAPASPYEPRHQGHVDISTGLYIREDEDIVLRGSPGFVWRRTYLSGDHVSRHFGIGATHNAEWYLIGDPQRFAWAELIRDDGSRIHFDRITPGQSYGNAVFGHTATPTEFYGALLGWVGVGWRMRLRDSRVFAFQACGPGVNGVCSLVAIRDADGGQVVFTRDSRGLVLAVTAGSERLTLEYDAQGRISKAADTAHHTVEYTYDARGRLERAVSDGGVIRTYAYGPADELLDIREPGREIENRFNGDGRLIHQTVRRPGVPDYEELFAYKVAGTAVVEADVTDDDGSREQYRFDERQQTMLESYEAPGRGAVMVSFDRGPGGFARALTVRCTKDGRRVTETVGVRGNEERTKAAVIARACN